MASRFLLATGIWVVLSVMSLFAQTFADVPGHISDGTGAVIPGAKILLTNMATNATRETVSRDSGVYTFAAVAPGVYKIRVEEPFFKISGSNNVQVQVQQTARLNFTLEVGSVTEPVEVSASALMLQSENVSLGTVIPARRRTPTSGSSRAKVPTCGNSSWA